MYHLDKCGTGQEITFEGGCSDCELDKYQPVDMPTSTNKCLSCKKNYGTKQKMSSSSSDCLREFYLSGHSSIVLIIYITGSSNFLKQSCVLLFFSHVSWRTIL